jgi:hypothetical protein
MELGKAGNNSTPPPAHYHAERFHQSLGGRLIEWPVGSANQNGSKGKVVCRSRLGGMLNFYHREAA